MRFASLGSGSSGNSLVVESDGTRILIDCGFSFRSTTSRLARLGLTPDDISAVFITHEHSDHIAGIPALAEKCGKTVYLSHGTREALNGAAKDWSTQLIWNDQIVEVGALQVTPFTVPHDAREPLQFTVASDGKKLSVLTDLGHATQSVEEHLVASDAMVLECNHDVEMLKNGSYPAYLKQRILGKFGHLSNEAAAALAAKVASPKLKTIVCAHLSHKNNEPEKAVAAVETALSGFDVEIICASQEAGCGWITI
jgi:phosphoribosyl 1,2-cyclic phosphodiesterase